MKLSSSFSSFLGSWLTIFTLNGNVALFIVMVMIYVHEHLFYFEFWVVVVGYLLERGCYHGYDLLEIIGRNYLIIGWESCSWHLRVSDFLYFM